MALWASAAVRVRGSKDARGPFEHRVTRREQVEFLEHEFPEAQACGPALALGALARRGRKRERSLHPVGTREPRPDDQGSSLTDPFEEPLRKRPADVIEADQGHHTLGLKPPRRDRRISHAERDPGPAKPVEERQEAGSVIPRGRVTEFEFTPDETDQEIFSRVESGRGRVPGLRAATDQSDA